MIFMVKRTTILISACVLDVIDVVVLDKNFAVVVVDVVDIDVVVVVSLDRNHCNAGQ